MKRLVLMLMLMTPLFVFAASIEWGAFSLFETGTGTIAIGYTGNEVFANSSVQIRAAPSGEKLNLAEEGTYLASFTAWTVAVVGETINADMLRDINRLFYRNDDIQVNNPFDVRYESDFFYFAFETLIWDNPEMSGTPQTQYGWVSIDVANGKLYIVDSALGLDGQSLVVGGGAVPEPTTGVLIVFGLVSLALKRRNLPSGIFPVDGQTVSDT